MQTLRVLLLWVLTVAILGLAIAWRITVDQPVKIPRDGPITLSATVKTQPKITGRTQIIAIGDSRLFVPLYPKVRVGDRLAVRGFVDGEGRIFNAEVEKVGQVPGIWSGLAGLRNRITDNINKLLPSREAALVSGMVLGIDEIDKDFRDQLIKTGTIHVVVVSGQNLSIVAGLFLALARYFGRRLSLLLATIAVFGYAVLTGLEPPVVRASLMVLVSSIAIYLGRERFALWSLILAALIILFFSPHALFEVSFQLTFAATLGIMTLGRWISAFALGRFLARAQMSFQSTEGPWPAANGVIARSKASSPRTKARGTLDILGTLFINNAAIATSAYLFTAPIILFYFERISPIAPIANFLVAELVLPLMILGFLIAGSSLVLMPLAQIFAYLAYVPALSFAKIVELFSNLT